MLIDWLHHIPMWAPLVASVIGGVWILGYIIGRERQSLTTSIDGLRAEFASSREEAAVLRTRIEHFEAASGVRDERLSAELAGLRTNLARIDERLKSEQASRHDELEHVRGELHGIKERLSALEATALANR